MKRLTNGEPWLDIYGNVIHAHGGCIIKRDNLYYWYGECRQNECFVNCYSSSDLHNWKFESTVLDTNCECNLLSYAEQLYLNSDGIKCNLERPKVIYCEKTNQFVMWMHYENGINYDCAMCAVATCDTPTGKFVFRGAFRPFGAMSRDLTVYCDDNGKKYMLSAANDNKDLHIYELTEDCLNVKELCSKQFLGQSREAPAVFKRNDKYYMLSSFCTGWYPNQGKFSVSDKPYDGWSEPIDFDNETTHQSQPAFVLPINENGEEKFLYFGDRWGGTIWNDGFDYEKSTVVCWEILFDENDSISLKIEEFF